MQDIVIRNLDYILTVSSHAIANASLDILANLEKSLDFKSSESWSHRRLPTQTATYPVIINSEEEDSETEFYRTRDNHSKRATSDKERNQSFDRFLQLRDDTNQGVCKQIRALRKKLQQIEMLEEKRSKGHLLDDQQIGKLQSRTIVESSLVELGVPIEAIQAKASSSVLPDGKGNKKVEISKKQKRKNKHMIVKGEEVHASGRFSSEPNIVKGFLLTNVTEVAQKVSSQNFHFLIFCLLMGPYNVGWLLPFLSN